MTTKTMPYPIPILAPIAGYVFVATIVSQALADILSLGTGYKAAIAGGVTALLLKVIESAIKFHKQRTDVAVTLDKERDVIFERQHQLHVQELAALSRDYQREKEFMEKQVKYHEALELAARKRLHAMVGEVQRCVIYITLAAECTSRGTAPPAFEKKTYDDVVAIYPLPDESPS